MKRLTILLSCLLAVGSALATGDKQKHAPPTKPAPTINLNPSQAQTQSQTLGQTQSQTLGQTQTSGASAIIEAGAAGTYSGDNDNLYVLPAPIFMPPMAPLPCPSAQITQQGVAIGWNFFSHTSGSTDTRDCTAIIVVNTLIDRCQYGRAQRALDLLAVRSLPGFEAVDAGYPDLSPKDCALIKSPPPPAKQSAALLVKPKAKPPCPPVQKMNACKS